MDQSKKMIKQNKIEIICAGTQLFIFQLCLHNSLVIYRLKIDQFKAVLSEKRENKQPLCFVIGFLDI